MSKWNKKLVKILTAASLAASLAFCAPCTQLGAYAATAVTDGVMIRNDATTEAGIIGSLNEGDEVTILDVLQSGDGYAWYYIQLENGNKGFVRSDLISADDSELAAFKEEEPEAQPQEEEPAEPAEEAQPEEQPQEETPAEAATAAAPETAEAVTTAQGYDAYSDPSANIVARFETDENGEGNWYVFNDDNGTRIRVRDLRDTEAAPAATGTPGIWRPLAIIFGILALAFAALALYLIKSIQDSRTKSSRRRTVEAVTEDENEEEDEFYFEDDEPEVTPDYEDEEDAYEEESSDSSEMTDSTIEAGDPEEAVVTDIPAEEIEAAIAAETEQIENSISEDEAPSAEEADEEVYSDTEELPEEASYKEEPAEEDTASEEVFDGSADPEEEYFEEDPEFIEAPAEEAAEDSDADYAGSDDDEEESVEEEESEEDYADEDFADEDGDDGDYDDDYEDEDYEDEDYEDDEDEDERSPRSRNAKKGGFFGFLSKIFGSSSKEDEDEGEDFDDEEDDKPVREFDEFKEYPEDIDLLPRDDYEDKEDLEEGDEADSYEEESGSVRDRLTMQKVMKNVDYREVETDFTDEDMDGLFDDDDDMEYSFISNTHRK